VKRIAFTLMALVLALGAVSSDDALASSKRSSLLPLPRWLMPAEKQTLNRVFGGATQTRVRGYLSSGGLTSEGSKVTVRGPAFAAHVCS
jgi:hypothetical protein